MIPIPERHSPSLSSNIENRLSPHRPEPPKHVQDSIDQFINQRSRVLDVKLEVFSGEIQERLRIHRNNLGSILYESLLIGSQILEFHPNYGIRRYDRSLLPALYKKQFDLSKEQRQQDVECWRDVVMVMRDFLVAWEAREQSQAKTEFLKHE